MERIVCPAILRVAERVAETAINSSIAKRLGTKTVKEMRKSSFSTRRTVMCEEVTLP